MNFFSFSCFPVSILPTVFFYYCSAWYIYKLIMFSTLKDTYIRIQLNEYLYIVMASFFKNIIFTSSDNIDAVALGIWIYYMILRFVRSNGFTDIYILCIQNKKKENRLQTTSYQPRTTYARTPLYRLHLYVHTHTYLEYSYVQYLYLFLLPGSG